MIREDWVIVILVAVATLGLGTLCCPPSRAQDFDPIIIYAVGDETVYQGDGTWEFGKPPNAYGDPVIQNPGELLFIVEPPLEPSDSDWEPTLKLWIIDE